MTHDKIKRKEAEQRMVEIGQVRAIGYNKDDDPEGFQRYRIIGKTQVDDTICQVTGYLTQIRDKNKRKEEDKNTIEDDKDQSEVREQNSLT